MKPKFSIPVKIFVLFITNIALLVGVLAWTLHQGWGMRAMPAFRSDKLEHVAAELFPPFFDLEFVEETPKFPFVAAELVTPFLFLEFVEETPTFPL